MIGTGFSKNINKNIAAIMPYMQKNSDCKLRRVMSGDTECAVFFLECMVSQKLLEGSVFAQLMEIAVSTGSLSDARKSATAGGQITEVKDPSECTSELANGMTLLFIDGIAGCLSIDVRFIPSRSIEEPSLDQTILGARDGFNENVLDSLALIRKRLRMPELCAETIFAGVNKTRCILVYGPKCKPQYVTGMRRKLKGCRNKTCLTVGDVLPMIADQKTLIPTQKTVERPDTACSLIQKGKIVLLMDGQPLAIALPIVLPELFESPNDAALVKNMGRSSRMLRYLAALISTLLPGLYVALINYNRSLLPSELITILIKNQAEVPLPLLAEVLVAWMLVSITFEVGLCLPSAVGGTIGIFGSIVLGQALVNARITSEITLLVVIIAAVSGYAMPNYPFSNCLRSIRMLVLLLSAAFGLIGTGLAVVATLARLFSLTSLSEPFMSIGKRKSYLTAEELEEKHG